MIAYSGVSEKSVVSLFYDSFSNICICTQLSHLSHHSKSLPLSLSPSLPAAAPEGLEVHVLAPGTRPSKELFTRIQEQQGPLAEGSVDLATLTLQEIIGSPSHVTAF